MLHTRIAPLLFVAAFGVIATAARADPHLLTPTNQSQLEAWLGVGPQQFTEIFSAVNGDGKTAEDFNAAADFKGATFTLASVNRGGNTYLIGGYDPVSWNGTLGDWIEATTTATQTAFIFNLTSDTIQRENHNVTGDPQTFDYSGIGPTWGLNFDLTFGDYTGILPDTLNYGSTFNYSYGGTFGTDILGDPDEFTPLHGGIYNPFTVNGLDVYTFAPVVTGGVPDNGATAAMLGAAVTGLALFLPRRKLS